jgi:DNA-binding GntR family transcriptional regulator
VGSAIYRVPRSSDATVSRALLRDAVYAQLCLEIVDGRLRPGEQLHDGELATRLGMSRTPVREALLRLGQIGLVIAIPGRRTVVAEIEPRRVHDAQEVVAAMHELAIRIAVPQLRADDIAAMREANRRFSDALAAGDEDAALQADDEVHAVLVQVAGNEALATILDQYTPVLRRAERQHFASLSGRRSVADHARLIDACEQGDVEGAVHTSNELWASLGRLIDLDLPDP